jgi:hypothetical protein
MPEAAHPDLEEFKKEVKAHKAKFAKRLYKYKQMIHSKYQTDLAV